MPRADRWTRLLDIEREPTLCFHTGSRKDCSDGSRRTTLFPDHLAQVGRCHVKTQNGAANVFDCFYPDLVRLFHQRPRKKGDQLRHLVTEVVA